MAVVEGFESMGLPSTFWSYGWITYTPIIVPAVNASDYFKRKTFPSIVLLQTMVDHT